MEPVGLSEDNTQGVGQGQSANSPSGKDEFTIVVHVLDPIVKKDGISQHTVYTIKGEDKNGEFEVIRRFSDFDYLRKSLQSRWPSCYIPPIPEKKSLGSMEQRFIEQRRYDLERFIQKVGELKHLWYSEEFQIFIKGTNPDIEKALSKLQTQTNQDIIQKYSSQFIYLSGKEINPVVEGKIESFTQYLKRINSMLINYKEFVKKTLQLREDENKQQDLLVSYLLPEYEKNCLSEYTAIGNDAKIIFSSTSDQKYQEIYQKMKEFSSSDKIAELYQLIKQESKEIVAFVECMDSRKSFKEQKEALTKKHRELKTEEGKIIAGKSSFKNVFSKKTKEESTQEIKRDIENTEQDISRVGEICDIMTIILGYVEIDRFKAEKEGLYFSTIKILAQYEIEFSKLKEDFWQYVLDNHNLSTI